MTFIQRLFWLTGIVSVAAIAAALPARAEVMSESGEATGATLTESVELGSLMSQAVETEAATAEPDAAVMTAEADMPTVADVLEDSVAETPVAEAPVAENAIAAEVIDASVSTSAASLLQTSDQIALSNPATSAIQPSESQTIAQTPGTSGQRVARFYLGTGGNIGIGDDDDSAIGDFGFAIISKFSLGPRLALRPSLLISDQDVSLAIPLTYNFTPIGVRNFTVAPFAGAGVDIAFDGDTGLLLNVGADIPLSRQFTLTNQANFRVTDDFSVGLIFGVAYNLPGLLQ